MDRSGKARLAVGTILLLLAACGGVALHHHDRPTTLDSWIFARVTISQGNRPANAVTWLGSAQMVALATLAGVAAMFRRNRNRAVVFMVAPALAGVLVEYVGKPLVDRHLYGGPCYPSGHATGVICVALIGFLASPRRFRPAVAAVGTVAVVAVSIAVVGLGWHFPTDVLGGICLGAGMMLALDGAMAPRAGPRSVPT